MTALKVVKDIWCPSDTYVIVSPRAVASGKVGDCTFNPGLMTIIAELSNKIEYMARELDQLKGAKREG